MFTAFCDQTLPKELWTHEAHLTVCWAALATRSKAGTIDFLRHAIRSYNLATGGENTATSGYHETLTHYFVHAVAVVDAPNVENVLSAPQCARDAPLRHWSRGLLFSREARERWVEPDLSPLYATA